MRNASRLEATSLMPPMACMRPVFPQVHFLPICLFDKCKHLPGLSGQVGEFPFLPWEKDAPAAWIVCEAGVRHPLEPYIRQKGRGISINHE